MDCKLWGGAALLLALTACGNLDRSMSSDYRPAVVEQGGDGQRYEADRQACETQVLRTASNYRPNDVMRFRECLRGKGYRLMN